VKKIGQIFVTKSQNRK